MKEKILLIVFVVGYVLLPTDSQNPADKCEMAGDLVCWDCQTIATCEGNYVDGFTFQNNTYCIPGCSCDDTNTILVENGICAQYNPSLTNCGCHFGVLCIVDPNNENVYTRCGGDNFNETIETFYCDHSYIEMSSCTCSETIITTTETTPPSTTTTSSITTPSTTTFSTTTSSTATPSTTIPSTTTPSTSTTTTTTLSSTKPSTTTPSTSTTTTTLSSTKPSTTIPSTSTTTTTTSTLSSTTPSCDSSPSTPTTTTSTTTPLTTITSATVIPCPEDCPFADDPTDDCRRYFQCVDGKNIPAQCPTEYCFDQATCQCIPGGITTPTICPPGCPFVDDPNDDCAKYFYCSTTGPNIPYTCQSTYCFDQSRCGCYPSSSTTSTVSTITPTISTITPTTRTTQGPLTCPPGCSFVDDPNDNCSLFYICDGGILVPSECPDALCFQQSTCQCV